MIYGFFKINDFVDNGSGSTNIIGELSEKGYTYSRDIKHYSANEGTLEVFDRDNDTTYITNNINAIGSEIAALFDNVKTGIEGPGALQDIVETALGANCSAVVLGASVLNPVNSTLYPVFIRFTYTRETNDIPIKIWLSNDSFLDLYPLGYLKLVYPVANLQNLYTNYTGVKATVDALSPTTLLTKLSTQVTYPVTGYDTFTVIVQNRLNTSQNFEMPIAVAYNGGPLFVTLANYLIQLLADLLNGSIYTEEDWITVIPSLVPINRYHIVPVWNNPAIDNVGVSYPICSPTIKANKFDNIANTYFPNTSAGDINTFLNYTTMLYKSLGLFILPAVDNPDGRIQWLTKFPDYFLVSLTDINIDQMSTQTKNIAVMLDRLVRIAESYEDGVTLPNNTIVETYESKSYISRSNGNIRLCVLIRNDGI